MPNNLLLNFVCECGCGESVSSATDFVTLHEIMLQFPEDMQLDMSIQLTNHTPLDDYRVYEVCGSLCLCKENEQ